MKISAKENMIRQYQIPGLPYRVYLCFVAHKLLTEIDEDGHPYYENDENDERQKLKENIDFTFIRINPDPDLMQVLIQTLKVQKYTITLTNGL